MKNLYESYFTKCREEGDYEEFSNSIKRMNNSNFAYRNNPDIQDEFERRMWQEIYSLEDEIISNDEIVKKIFKALHTFPLISISIADSGNLDIKQSRLYVYKKKDNTYNAYIHLEEYIITKDGRAYYKWDKGLKKLNLKSLCPSVKTKTEKGARKRMKEVTRFREMLRIFAQLLTPKNYFLVMEYLIKSFIPNKEINMEIKSVLSPNNEGVLDYESFFRLVDFYQSFNQKRFSKAQKLIHNLNLIPSSNRNCSYEVEVSDEVKVYEALRHTEFLGIKDPNAVRTLFKTLYKVQNIETSFNRGCSLKRIKKYFDDMKNYYKGKNVNVDTIFVNRLTERKNKNERDYYNYYSLNSYESIRLYSEYMNLLNEYNGLPTVEEFDKHFYKKSLLEVHDLLSAMLRDARAAIKKVDYQYREVTKEFVKDVDDYEFRLPANSVEVARLSDDMKNCVSGYADRIKDTGSNEGCLIVYARKKGEKKASICIELSPNVSATVKESTVCSADYYHYGYSGSAKRVVRQCFLPHNQAITSSLIPTLEKYFESINYNFIFSNEQHVREAGITKSLKEDVIITEKLDKKKSCTLSIDEHFGDVNAPQNPVFGW